MRQNISHCSLAAQKHQRDRVFSIYIFYYPCLVFWDKLSSLLRELSSPEHNKKSPYHYNHSDKDFRHTGATLMKKTNALPQNPRMLAQCRHKYNLCFLKYCSISSITASVATLTVSLPRRI